MEQDEDQNVYWFNFNVNILKVEQYILERNIFSLLTLYSLKPSRFIR